MDDATLRRKPGQPIVWYHQKRAQSNQHCLYCNAFLGVGSAVKRNKEHLIGRNFVPTGTINEGERFNFIFAVCETCNLQKSKYENHVSAISLLWSPLRKEPAIDVIAVRKATGTYHGKLAAQALKSTRLAFEYGEFHLGIELAIPPQVDSHQVKCLAAMQVQALVSLVKTTNHLSSTELFRLNPANIWYYKWFPVSDWGNPQLVEAVRRVHTWERIATINAAGGAFRATLRQSPGSDEWFWGLEWNGSIRVIGALGSPETPPTVLADIPPLEFELLPDGRRGREEVPASAADEHDLFGLDTASV